MTVAFLAGLAVAFAAATYRVMVGPRLADRAIAADVCYLTVLAALAAVAVLTGRTVFVDVVLVAAGVGVLSTVAIAWMVEHRPEAERDVRHPKEQP